MQFHFSFSNMLAAVLLQHASGSPFLSAQGDTLVKVFHFFLEPRGYPQKWIYHFNIQLKCTSSHLNQLFNVDLQQNGPTHRMCRETIWDPKTMHDSTIFWCLIDGQVTPPLSPHGHELRALQQLWEQKEVLENCDAFVKISSSGVFLFFSFSFVVMIYFGPFFFGRWTHGVPRWLDSWQPLGQRLYQNCRAPNLMKKTDCQRRTYHCITDFFL